MVVQKVGNAQLQNPLSTLHLLDTNETASHYRNLPLGNPHDNLNTVGIKDFIYCPQCVNWKLVTAPPDYHMFILTKPNSPNNIVLVQHALIQKTTSFTPAPCPEKPHRLAETWPISHRLAMFYREAKSDYPGRNLLLQDLAWIITSLLLQGTAKIAAISSVKHKNKDISLAVNYLHQNFHKQITLKELAIKANYSQYYFIRIFQKETGKTPFEYLSLIRLEKAKELLKASNMSITEICLQCGFQNSSHFANFFKNHIGVSPTDYRQRM